MCRLKIAVSPLFKRHHVGSFRDVTDSEFSVDRRAPLLITGLWPSQVLGGGGGGVSPHFPLMLAWLSSFNTQINFALPPPGCECS